MGITVHFVFLCCLSFQMPLLQSSLPEFSANEGYNRGIRVHAGSKGYSGPVRFYGWKSPPSAID